MWKWLCVWDPGLLLVYLENLTDNIKKKNKNILDFPS